MLILRGVATGLFVVAVPVFLVLTFVRIAAVEPRVHEYGFSRYDAVEATGIDRAQLDRAAREIIRYFRDDEEVLDIRVTVDGAEEPLFNEREVLHMRDVKELMQFTFRVHEIAFAYLVSYVAAVFLWSRERPLRQLAQQALVAGLGTVGLLGVAALSVLIGFDALFRQFHVLSFANDFWQLSLSRDHLVQMYQQGFWFDVTLAVGVLSVATGGLLAGLSYLYVRHARRTQPTQQGEGAAVVPDVVPDVVAEPRG